MTFADDKLSKYTLDEKGNLILNGRPLVDLLKKAKKKFTEKQIELRLQKEKKEKERRERLKQIAVEEERRRAEAAKFFAAQTEKQRMEREKLKKEQERREKERREKEKAFQAAFDDDFSNQETQIRDVYGNRWIKCKYCGIKACESEFITFGGGGEINLGTCKECSRKNLDVDEEEIQTNVVPRRKYDPYKCPECGGQLIKKTGMYGEFMGCKNYPQCRYTRRIV